MVKKFTQLLLLLLVFCVQLGFSQIATWNFTGLNNVATANATSSDANLTATPSLSRGTTAASSAGNNSFRTVGFQNNGIATTNTDYFEVTFSPKTGYKMSLSSIDATFAGTASFAASPGVSNQFAYSLNGTSFTLIDTAFILIGTPSISPQINLAAITALQNIPFGTTVYLRYYASGQTTTGGWGFNSPNTAANGLIIGGTVTATTSTPTVSITAGTNAAEPSVPGTFDISFSPETTASTDVTLSLGGTATASTDYSISTSVGSITGGVLTVPSGTSSVTITVTPIDDAINEGTETVILTLSSPSAGYTLGAASSATINITDNDAPPTLSIAAGTNASEPSTKGNFTVNIASALATDATVNIAFTGTATAADYTVAAIAPATLVSGVLTIPAGTTSATIEITPIDDTDIEGSETIIATISGASANVTLGTATATINLLDNDIPKVVISQVYGGGGNSGATYKNDFIELYNNSGIAINLAGWSVQYAAATGTFSSVNTHALTGTIQPYSFFLIQEAAGTGGTVDLVPDATGTLALGATNGKVILANTTTANPGAGNIVDKVGFGTANDFETAATPALSNTTAAIRKVYTANIDSLIDSDNNSADFDVASPKPRNSTYKSSLPAVTSYSPLDNATGVSVNPTLVLTFNKPVSKGTGNITIGSNTIDVTSSAVSISGLQVSITGLTLTGNTAYAVLIDAGAFKDEYNNNYTGISDATTWNFTTIDPNAALVPDQSFNLDGCTGSGLLPNNFTQYSQTGAIVWDCTTFGRDPAAPAGSAAFGAAIQINGYSGGTNIPNVDWLISPKFDLSATNYPLLSFYSRTAFNGQPLQLKVSTNYTGSGDPALATWTDVNGKFPAQASNTWTLSNNINLSAFKTSSVYFAFVYNSSDEEGARWTVDDIAVTNSATPPPASLTVSTDDVQFSYAAAAATVDKTFTLTGNDITGDITVTSNAAAFLLSTNGTSYSSSITFTQAEANNTTKTVYARFAPTTNNQNYSGTYTVSTTGVSNTTVDLSGTSIDPISTLEVVNWNMEWFATTDPTPGYGPTNKTLQATNAATILNNLKADIYCLVEVVNETALANIVSNMPGYSYIICNYGSHTNITETGGSYPLPLNYSQKEAFVYKTSMFSNISARALISKGINTAADVSSDAYNWFSSGRYPYMMSADVTLGTGGSAVTKPVNFVLLHAKANTSPTATSYARRKSGADILHDSLNLLLPPNTSNVVLLGDLNDDLDVTITDGITPNTTSYSAFTSDANYFSPTLALSLAGKKSTVGYSDMIDHVILSTSMEQYYMSNTANTLTDVTSLVSSYGSTTSDHYPIFTRYSFDPSVVLPVKLVSFGAQKQGTTALINWKTSQEINSKYFVVERSLDGINYTAIGTVNAVVNSNTVQQYSLTDFSPATGINYYRLKMVDQDGSLNYSGIAAVQFGNPAISLQVYPNPVTNSIRVSIGSTEAIAQWELLNVEGKVLMNGKGNNAAINATLNTKVNQLNAGMYMLRAVINGKTQAAKFIKK